MATSNKAVPIILVGALALGILAYFGMSYPPGDGVTGTVAPAERYRAEQDNEIQLGDESIQDVLQSDVFERLINDEAFQAASASEQARALMFSFAASEAFGSPAVRGALSSAELFQGLSDERFSRLFQSAEMWRAMDAEALRGPLSADAFRNFVASTEFGEAFSVSELAFAFSDEQFRRTLASQDFNSLMAEELRSRGGRMSAEALNAAFSEELFGNIEALSALRLRFNDERLLRSFDSESFRRNVTSDLFIRAMSVEAFRNIAGTESLRMGLQSPSFEKIFGTEELRGRFADAEMIRAFSDANIRGPFANEQFRTLAFQSDAFKAAFSDANFARAWRSSEALRTDAFDQAFARRGGFER